MQYSKLRPSDYHNVGEVAVLAVLLRDQSGGPVTGPNRFAFPDSHVRFQ